MDAEFVLLVYWMIRLAVIVAAVRRLLYCIRQLYCSQTALSVGSGTVHINIRVTLGKVAQIFCGK